MTADGSIVGRRPGAYVALTEIRINFLPSTASFTQWMALWFPSVDRNRQKYNIFLCHRIGPHRAFIALGGEERVCLPQYEG